MFNNSDAFMSAGKKEVRFYLDETEYPLSDYVAEWVEWKTDHKIILRTLRSFVPPDTDPMAVRTKIIEINGDDTPVWFMGALRHLTDHRPRPQKQEQTYYVAVYEGFNKDRLHILDEFRAADDREANDYAEANYPEVDWYVLDANKDNINA